MLVNWGCEGGHPPPAAPFSFPFCHCPMFPTDGVVHPESARGSRGAGEPATFLHRDAKICWGTCVTP